MAATSIRQALELALQHQRAGRLREAELICRKILDVKPDEPNALQLVGLSRLAGGDAAGAVDFLKKTAEVDGRASVLVNLGVALHTAKRYDEAVSCLQGVAGTSADCAEAHYNLGKVYVDMGRLEEAVAAYQAAVGVKPGLAEGWMNLGNTLRNVNRLDAALEAAGRAIALKPDSAEFHYNLGHIHKDLHRFDQALHAYSRAAALNPNYGEPRRDASFLKLLLGDFVEGWREYEWRWKCKEAPLPSWHGTLWPWQGHDLRGRSILLSTEQGFGDAIQFIRYVPMLVERGAEVSVVCARPLHRLFSTMAGIRQILGPGDVIHAFDFHAMLLSLPHLLGTTLETVPAKVPYLSAGQGDVARWAERIGGNGEARKVGLVWAGNPGHTNDRLRSISLELLKPLREVPGVKFFSLQKGAPPAELAEWGMTDFSADLNDFADTAALIANLDLVIAVDTSVAHLAGALGKPVWILLPHVPDWRWLLNRDGSPWYPTARLFRQKTRADWSPVVAAVVSALAER